MTAAFVYVTAGNKEEALKIGSALVDDRLAACANVLDGMTSVYRWEGEVQNDSEAVLIVKTRDELVEQVVERVKELHSYDCPAVVSWPVTGGHRLYLDWIERETSR